jgi:hypothetical protein
VERLREVRAFIGFNRWRSMNEFGDVSGVTETEAERLVPIRRRDDPLSSVPAADVQGEGVFIQLREDAVMEWEAKIWHSDWAKEFSDAYAARLKSRGVSSTTDDTATFRRILVHSLSHALMREFALESGYGRQVCRSESTHWRQVMVGPKWPACSSTPPRVIAKGRWAAWSASASLSGSSGRWTGQSTR